ncbi:hypothetical protein N7532_004124 [Penicillium argentinense]|uniref:Uncharacterized protein n=1 Tax=Penicillium argentinense TaxID=1131581 RepID=A0A9W9FP89_9EURO|nr:uncharacterized protein N7532_004124 [Penicillium argentinense]KAJ5103595.1 hypothetical protein N7532_004124 [Penicillium argentinense]
MSYLNSDVFRLKGQVRHLEQEVSTHINLAHSAMSHTNNRLSTIEANLEWCTQQVDTFAHSSADTKDHQEILSVHHGRLEDQQAKLDGQLAQLDQVTGYLRAREPEVKKLEARIEELEQHSRECKFRLEQLGQRDRVREAQLKKMQDSIVALMSQNKDLELKIRQSQKTIMDKFDEVEETPLATRSDDEADDDDDYDDGNDSRSDYRMTWDEDAY